MVKVGNAAIKISHSGKGQPGANYFEYIRLMLLSYSNLVVDSEKRDGFDNLNEEQQRNIRTVEWADKSCAKRYRMEADMKKGVSLISTTPLNLL